MRLATLVVYLALAAIAAIAAAAARNDGAHPHSLTTEIGGSFSFANSREGMPVFTAANIGPGSNAKGTVEIANEGSEAIAVTLARHDLVDTPGAGDGILSRRLVLTVKDLSSATPVYEGPLAAMPPQPLARLAPGASRTYEFVAALPESGTTSSAENSLQGASTSVAYSWTAAPAPAHGSSPSTPAPPGRVAAPTRSSSASRPPSPFSVRILGHRDTLRNGRLIVWARCSQPCRIASQAELLAAGPHRPLRPTARHAQRRRFGARTRRLALRVPSPQPGPLAAATAKARIVVVAHNRTGERAAASKLLRLRSPTK